MAWSAPKVDFASGNVVTAAQMNALGNNLRFLKGLDGDVSIEDDVLIANAKGLVVGHTAKVAAWGGVTPELQVLGVGNADSTIVIGQWNTTDALQPVLNFVKSGHGTIGSTTTVADNETLGAIYWSPDDSSNFQNLAASFHAEVDDGSPETDGVGTAFVWKQQPGGGTTAARETMRIAADGTVTIVVGGLTFTAASTIATSAGALTLTPTTDVLIAEGKGLVIGHTAQVQAWDTYELQALGTVSPDSGVIIGNWNTSTGMPPVLNFVKSLNASIGSTAIVSDNTQLGGIYWTPDDGADIRNLAARFFAEVDDGSPEATGVGTAFVWSHQPGGGTTAARETWRITAAGDLTSAGAGFDLDMNNVGHILNVGAAGNDWTANSLILSSANAGGLNAIYINNSATSDTASHSTMQINAHSGGGDTKIGFAISGGANWHIGIDNSASDILSIGPNSDVGHSTDGLRMTTATQPIITYNTTHPTGVFDFACDACGKTSPDMFSCCGAVRWRDDVMDYRAMAFRTPDALDYMERVGVIERSIGCDGKSSTFTVLGKDFEFAMSAAFQNRQRMDDQYAELKAEIKALKGRG